MAEFSEKSNSPWRWSTPKYTYYELAPNRVDVVVSLPLVSVNRLVRVVRCTRLLRVPLLLITPSPLDVDITYPDGVLESLYTNCNILYVPTCPVTWALFEIRTHPVNLPNIFLRLHSRKWLNVRVTPFRQWAWGACNLNPFLLVEWIKNLLGVLFGSMVFRAPWNTR